MTKNRPWLKPILLFAGALLTIVAAEWFGYETRMILCPDGGYYFEGGCIEVDGYFVIDIMVILVQVIGSGIFLSFAGVSALRSLINRNPPLWIRIVCGILLSLAGIRFLLPPTATVTFACLRLKDGWNIQLEDAPICPLAPIFRLSWDK